MAGPSSTGGTSGAPSPPYSPPELPKVGTEFPVCLPESIQGLSAERLADIQKGDGFAESLGWKEKNFDPYLTGDKYWPDAFTAGKKIARQWTQLDKGTRRGIPGKITEFVAGALVEMPHLDASRDQEQWFSPNGIWRVPFWPAKQGGQIIRYTFTADEYEFMTMMWGGLDAASALKGHVCKIPTSHGNEFVANSIAINQLWQMFSSQQLPEMPRSFAAFADPYKSKIGTKLPKELSVAEVTAANSPWIPVAVLHPDESLMMAGDIGRLRKQEGYNVLDVEVSDDVILTKFRPLEIDTANVYEGAPGARKFRWGAITPKDIKDIDEEGDNALGAPHFRVWCMRRDMGSEKLAALKESLEQHKQALQKEGKFDQAERL
ncbi:MAG: hypothetical protein HYV02_03815, partial [Deltaproteobacteria bacterium]|nr:hypothetical protein [Deltaproteobacteria bacterium]